MLASVLMASRLPSSAHVCAFMLLAIQLFGFFPGMKHFFKVHPFQKHTTASVHQPKFMLLGFVDLPCLGSKHSPPLGCHVAGVRTGHRDACANKHGTLSACIIIFDRFWAFKNAVSLRAQRFACLVAGCYICCLLHLHFLSVSSWYGQSSKVQNVGL